ncbi:hypothetical protein AB0H87_40320, partial [Asanoa sp. NPDC050611]
MDASDRDRRADEAHAAVDRLAAGGIDGVALTWVDTSGVTRVKAVPLARLPHAAAWGAGAAPVFDTFVTIQRRYLPWLLLAFATLPLAVT